MSAHRLIIFITFATLVIVIFIATLLVSRHGHSTETTKILDSIEGVRQQNSAEHSALQGEQRAQGNILRRILTRFGFLDYKE